MKSMLVMLEQLSQLQQSYPELTQLAAMLALWPVAWLLSRLLLKASVFQHAHDSRWRQHLVTFLHDSMLFLVWFMLLVLARSFATQQGWTAELVTPFQSLLAIMILIRYTLKHIKAKRFARLIIYTIIPLIILNALDMLRAAIDTLETYSLDIGNIHFSLYDLLRVAYFGVILFWLGKESSRIGKEKIRAQEKLDSSTREIIAKLFEVALYIVVFLVLLNILGINLTTLAVLGGAIGVGIGFGLQSIASNFISGLIILLDRSLSIGDYIELDDGRSGTIRELNLRAVTLETFDGKDIVVPNDVFFSESFTNWTHKNQRQRYAFDFQVAYSTDLDALFPLVKKMLGDHPQVLAGDAYSFEEQPDIEIVSFADSGIELHVEFWMDAIDDGENRVGADLLYGIWKLMKENGFEFPFPQREVRILNADRAL